MGNHDHSEPSTPSLSVSVSRSRSRPGHGPLGRAACLVGAALIVAAAAFESGMPLGTWRARCTTFGCALAVAVAGTLWQHFRHRPGATPAGATDPASAPNPFRPAGALVWLAVVAIAATWDVLGLLTPPDEHHLTLSALVLAYQALHALVFAFWLTAGWFLFAVPIRRRART